MSVYSKLMAARIALQGKELKKSGLNKFAGYNYFELGDFLPSIQEIFAGLKLCGVVSYTADIASLKIIDTEDGSEVVVTSPMGSAALKGCHEVQNIGAVETYQRRYLWVTAMEIVEHDVLDAVQGKGVHKATDGAFDALDSKAQNRVADIAALVNAHMDEGRDGDAFEALEDAAFSPDEKVAIWTFFDSKKRSALKKLADSHKAKGGA